MPIYGPKSSVAKDVLTFCGHKEILKMIHAARDIRDKAIVSGLFLTACRVSEFIQLTTDNFVLDPPQGPQGKPHILVRNAPVLKRPKNPAIRNFPILLSEPETPYLVEYIKTLNPGDTLFPLTRQRIGQILRDIEESAELPYHIYPHWFRSQRCCQLVLEHGYDVAYLVKFIKWAEPKHAVRYFDLSYEDLLARMSGASTSMKGSYPYLTRRRQYNLMKKF